MNRQRITAGWLTLRPFTPDDIPWVYEVLLEPVLQRFMQVPSPYRLVGYWVDPRARRRGVAATAVRAVCRRAVSTAGIELIECHGVRAEEWVGSLLRDEAMAQTCSR